MLPRAPRLILTLAALAVCGPRVSLAAEVQADERPRAEIRFGNRTIATLRGSLLGYSAHERAAAAERRLEDQVERTGPEALKAATRESDTGVVVTLDGHAVFMITPDDVNTLLDETPASVAEMSARALERSVAEMSEERQPRAFLLSTFRLSVVTLLWLLALRGLYFANRWFSTRFPHRPMPGGAGAVEAPLASVHLFACRVFSVAAWTLGLFVTSTWLSLALGSFAWTRPFGEQVEGSLIGLLRLMATEILDALPGLMVVLVIVLLIRSLIWVIRPIFERVERGDVETGIVNKYTAATTRRLVTGLLWMFALAMAYPYLPGSQTEAFKGLSVLAGLMFSLGASGVVGQGASGLIILYAHALRPGQYVRVGDSEGTIVEIGLFSTRLRTGLGEDVLVPNSFILANNLKNFSRPRGAGFVLDTGVTIGYDVPWRQVQAMLLAAARRVPSVAPSPAPYVIQTALADFYVAYRLVACSEESVPRQRMAVLNDLHAAIQDVFNENGVQIMSPHYVFDPRAPKVVPKEKWHEAPASRDEKG